MTDYSLRGRRGKKIPMIQRQLISIWGREGWSNRDIQVGLIAKIGEEGAASLRVIQNQTKGIKDGRIPWDRLQTDGYDAGLVLEILAELNRQTNGKKILFTQDEADWIAWICKAAPNLPPYGVWMIAQLYINESKQINPQFSQIDLFLGSRCWESFDSIIEYADANLPVNPDPRLERNMPLDSLIVEVASKFRHMFDEDEEVIRKMEVMAESGDPGAIFALALYESTEARFDDDQHGYQYGIRDDDLSQAKDNEELRLELSSKSQTYSSDETADAVDWVKAEAQAQAKLEEILQQEEVESGSGATKIAYLPDETAEIVNSLDS